MPMFKGLPGCQTRLISVDMVMFAQTGSYKLQVFSYSLLEVN